MPAIRTPSSAALIDAANAAGGKDNVTAVYVESGRRDGCGPADEHIPESDAA